MARLDTLMRFFPTGTTEGERQFLERAFVPPGQLAEVLSFPSGSPRIVVGNKGVGKSAVLEWINAAAGKQHLPSLLLRPDDLDMSTTSNATDVGTLKREMYNSLLLGVATALGAKLGGFLSGDAAKLYKTAVVAGQREPDWGTNLLRTVSDVAKKLTQSDAFALANELEAKTPGVLLRDVVVNYLVSRDKVFFLLFDDTDQVASPDRPEHLNRIWSLLLAFRKLAQESPSIRCLVSLRNEVWLRLIHTGQGQRDQIDHVRPLVVYLRTNEEHMGTILERRIGLAAQECNLPNSAESFFEDSEVRLPTSDAVRKWRSFLLKNSRERPRDMIQLVRHLARNALERGAIRIGQVDVDQTAGDYSRERAEDLNGELGNDCPVLSDVIRSFAGLDFEMSFEDLRRHLHTVPSRFSTSVRQRVLKPDNDDDAIALLAILHEAGFVNPRIPDITRTREFTHVMFLDQPGFVQRSRWNELQTAAWDIHPVFRSYLLSLEDAKARRRIFKPKH